MSELTVRMNLRAFEHARIDRGLSKRQMAHSLGWHAGSLSNLLCRARQGRPVRISTVAALAWVLALQPAALATDRLEFVSRD